MSTTCEDCRFYIPLCYGHDKGNCRAEIPMSCTGEKKVMSYNTVADNCKAFSPRTCELCNEKDTEFISVYGEAFCSDCLGVDD
jgi:hypothetical protein